MRLFCPVGKIGSDGLSVAGHTLPRALRSNRALARAVVTRAEIKAFEAKIGPPYMCLKFCGKGD
jgi:hypothetical protein